jgi:hypothetical protein
MTGFEKKVFSSVDFKSLVQILLQNLSNDHIQIFSKKPEIQSLVESLNFAGLIPKELPTNQDYLLVSNTAIGGNKTDKYIKQRYTHTTSLTKSGKVENTLTIKRHHSFTNSEEYKWQNYLAPFGVTKMVDFTRYILGRGDNKVAVKVYVPAGSKLVSSSLDSGSFKTYFDKSINKTYFLFEMSLKPQATKEITLVYEPKIDLDFKPVANYELQLQNQPGSLNTVFEKKYAYQSSDSPRVYSHIPELQTFDSETGEPSLGFELKQDTLLKGVFAK